MDPLSAIGLAGNILSFIDYGLRLCDMARQISSSPSTLTNDKSVGTVARELKGLVTRLDSGISTSGSLGAETDALQILAAECQDVAQELLDLLEEFQPNNSRSRRESFKLAWKKMMNEGKQRNLEQSLARLGSYLNLQLNQLSQYVGSQNPRAPLVS